MTAFAAAIPQPAHQLPGSALATGIRDALVASSFRAHMAPPPAFPGRPGSESRKPRRHLLPAELVEQANALCLILGVEPFPVPVVKICRPQPRPGRRIELSELLQRVAVMEADEVRAIGRGKRAGGRREWLARRREDAWERAGGRP